MTLTRSESSSGSRPTAASRFSLSASQLPDASRRLAIALRPVDGENVHGYLRRLADANGHKFLDTFLHALGFRGTVGPMGRDDMWHRLAAWTELPVGAFASMRWRPTTSTGRPALSVLGMPFTRALVHPRSMRFCPACLRSDGIRRDFWSLAYVVACPIHSCLLVDACLVCQERFDTAPIGSPVACRCGERFDQSEGQTAPPFTVRLARNLALMVGEKSSVVTSGWELDLPAQFKDICANDYMAYLDVIGTAATTPAEEDRRVDGPRRRYAHGSVGRQPAIPIMLARIGAATPIMDGWPAMLHCLLDDLRARGDGRHEEGISSALATTVGKSLLRPRRGADGLPLPLIHEAVDQYRQLYDPKGHRKRNLTVESAAALKLHTYLNATTLAIAVGDHQASGIHARILRRVFDEMALDEVPLPPADVAELALERCVGRYHAVVAAVTGHAAAYIIEGRAAKGTLLGWDHPDLLPIDPALQGLRCKDVTPVYSNASVCKALERLRAVSRTPPAQTHDLSPLVSVAMRRAPLRPWFNKTALLLDVMNGTVPVYAAVDQPRLNDLLINLQSLRNHIAAKSPSLRSEYATLANVNALLLEKLGPGSAVSMHTARRLVRAQAVGFVLQKSTAANRKRPVVQRLYRIADMVAIVTGRREATDCECDITECVAELLRDGKSFRATAGALTRLGFLTINGAPWTHRTVSMAMARVAVGQRLLATITRTP